MTNTIKILSLIILFGVSNISCFVAPVDALYSYDDLIEKTETILLVQLTNDSRKNKSYEGFLVTNKGNFHIIEELKGVAPKKTDLFGFYNKYSANDFSNHNDSIFWQQNSGRTPLVRGECGPSHVYELNKQYLIFIESQNNCKAAELINSKEDKWYNYVKKQIN